MPRRKGSSSRKKNGERPLAEKKSDEDATGEDMTIDSKAGNNEIKRVGRKRKCCSSDNLRESSLSQLEEKEKNETCRDLVKEEEEIVIEEKKVCSRESSEEPLQNKNSQCSACGKEMETKLSLAPVFVCTECDCIVLCLNCFASRAEPENHVTSHSYRIRSSRVEMFEQGWSVRDELVLLDSIERYGLGNWCDAAESVGCGHTARDCEQHYYKLYAGRYGSYLPQRYRVDHASAWIDISQSVIDLSSFDYMSRIQEEKEEANDTNEKEDYKYRPDGQNRPEMPTFGSICSLPIEITQLSANDEEILKKNRSELIGAELFGYMPLRGDFDVEHDNQAEVMIADLEFKDDDTPDDRLLKQKILRAYEERLEEREKRKQYLLHNNLLDYKTQGMHNNIAPDRREIQRQITNVERFHDSITHSFLCDGILASDRLKRKLDAILSHIKIEPSQQKQTNSHQLTNNFPTVQSYPIGPSSISRLHRSQRPKPRVTYNRPSNASPEDGDNETLLLSNLERSICETLQLPAKKYIEIKEALATGFFFW
mmetsp:Transcript_24035/g.30080  ORF Transcript_24035/g.30080 Transcript_24035/m.30080 type:complete len:539 (-) Transcript_24035:511-2127(-)